MGIDVAVDAPDVGANLQDHLEVYAQYLCTQPVSIYQLTKPMGKLRVGLEWLLKRSGPAASCQFETGGFATLSSVAAHPDIQWHFLPIAIDYDGKRLADCIRGVPQKTAINVPVFPQIEDKFGTIRASWAQPKPSIAYAAQRPQRATLQVGNAASHKWDIRLAKAAQHVSVSAVQRCQTGMCQQPEAQAQGRPGSR
jgi:choline dehydrogenase-like flavoprotein